MTPSPQSPINQLADSVFRRIDNLCGIDPVKDFELAIKSRLLILVSCVACISVTSALINGFAVSSDVTAPKIVGMLNIVIIASVPILLITSKQIVLPATIFCVTAMGGITSGLIFNGGLHSHFVVNLPLVSVMAGWLINMRAGLLAGAYSIGMFLFLGSDLASLVVVPSLLSPEQLIYMRMSTAISSTISALVVVWCFQLATMHALMDAREAKDAADRANRAKSDFLANMSHELRTPLNGVVAVAGTLKKTKLSGEQGTMVDLISSSGQTLERLLSDVLDVSKIEAGRLDIEKIPFDFEALVREIVDLFKPLADEKNLDCKLTIGPRLAPAYMGDPTRIRQILTNLLSNAVKFTSEGSITVNAHIDNTLREQPFFVLSVLDTGVGFDKSLADALFDPFIQEDGSINRRFGGTGLGLFICKSLTEAMGGRISATSRVGEGAYFKVEIPTVCVDEPAAPVPMIASPIEVPEKVVCSEEQKPTAPATDDGLLQILLVEDHATNRKIVELILGPLDVAITSVENGQEALEAFGASSFDLILMDMQMPVMDGLTATKEIRRLEASQDLPRTPIAMLTANAMANHVTDALNAGADAHIAKPITPDSLIKSLSDLLEKTGRKRLMAA